MIINKILFDNSITFWGSLVSQYNHIKARKEVSGIDAKIPANRDERFAISDTATTVIAVIKVLIIK